MSDYPTHPPVGSLVLARLASRPDGGYVVTTLVGWERGATCWWPVVAATGHLRHIAWDAGGCISGLRPGDVGALVLYATHVRPATPEERARLQLATLGAEDAL